MLFSVLGGSAREVRDVLRAATATDRRLRNHLVTIVVASIGVDLFCAIVAFFLEHNAQQTDIKTFGSAAFWTTTQLLTVSSNIKNPISAVWARFGARGGRTNAPMSVPRLQNVTRIPRVWFE